MELKQLLETSKQVQKASDGGDPPSAILTLLKPLEGFTATEALLRQSKIGVSVAKLRQNKDPKVSELASRLVNKWKADVKKSVAGSSPKPAPGKVNGTPTNGGASSPVPGQIKAEGKAPRKSKAAPAKRNAEADEVDWKVTGNATRDACLKLIYNGLSFMSEEGPDEILVAAQKVEYAAFDQYQPETSNEYKSKMRSLFLNLKMEENSDLRRDVFQGSIEPKRFVTMTSDELRSSEKRAEDAAIERENMSKAMTAQEEKAISTTYVFDPGLVDPIRHLVASARKETRMTCGKCRQSRVAYSQAQTRSADEPMTTFCECTNCGHRWKFS